MSPLDVYLKGCLVGSLEESADGLLFVYKEDYLRSAEPECLSHVLPLRLSGILDYQEFEDIEDGDFPPSSMFTGMKRWLVQELQQSDS